MSRKLEHVRAELKQLLPDHYELFTVSESSTEIRITLRFAAQVILRNDHTPLAIQLRDLVFIMHRNVVNKSTNMLSKL